MATLEHVNITVADPDKTAATLSEIYGWKVRWKGAAKLGGLTVHVGEEDTYLAVWAPPKDYDGELPDAGRLNHVGIVVDDLDETEKRVKRAGYEPYSHADYEPGRRFYYDDENGIEFEVVSYA